jgi:hypothetical protein
LGSQSPIQKCSGILARNAKAFREITVGLSMMCYTLGKEKRTCLGDFQLSGLIGKLLY